MSQRRIKHHQCLLLLLTTLLLLLRHPCHCHPLELRHLSNQTWPSYCHLCHRKKSVEAYTCQEGCSGYFHYHRACVEAPPQIDSHPLHPDHSLTLSHGRPPFECDACHDDFNLSQSSFRCDKCDFDLDIGCALSMLSDEGGSLGGKTSEQITLPVTSAWEVSKWMEGMGTRACIVGVSSSSTRDVFEICTTRMGPRLHEFITLPLHPHKLTSFFTRHDFVRGSDCCICLGSVEGDGYMCLDRWCDEFVIHKRCIQDLYYADGTKAPRVYHGHQLATFVGEEDTCLTRCDSCGSDKSGEFIGCASCDVFYHRNCFQVPEILRYPSHYPDHTLALFLYINTVRQCQSCSRSLKNEIYYRCTSCEFFVHVRCALQVVTYCEQGMSAKIEFSWYKHPLLLCHRAKSFRDKCFCCQDEFDGPAYVCRVEDCELVLHKQCTELAPKINHHPHHPEHPLTFLAKGPEGIDQCAACCLRIEGFSFSCELCHCYLHVKCMSRFPTRKHYLHEHDLVQFDKISSAECNRCRTADNSPIFRCIPCNFNLHEKCMELPLVVKHETHFHPLTLRDFFMEDDTGEYYCDLCEERRDGRLGVYVCGDCERKMDRPWAFHIECVLSELRKVYVKKDNTIAMERLADEITRREDQVRATEKKLDEMKRELEEVRKKHTSMALEHSAFFDCDSIR